MSPFHRVLPSMVVLLLAAPAGQLFAAAIPISGSVVASGQRIAGAQVTLVAAADPSESFESLFADRKISPLAATRSERDGSFELLAPETGFFRVLVEAEGYLGTLRWVYALTPAFVPVGQVDLVPARRFRLTVRDPQGQAVAGARIRLRFKEQGLVRWPRWPLFYTSAADGSVVVAAPAGEEALAVAAAPGFALGVVPLAAGAAAAEIRLEAGTSLAIQAVDPQRRALPDVGVMVAALGTAIGRTGRDGKAVVQLLPGQEKLELLDAAGRRAAASVPAAPAAGPLRVELAEPRQLSGQVVEAPGQAPIEGAWVFVWTWPPLFTRSDRGGLFELAVAAAGEFEVQAAKEGYLRAHAPAAGPAPLLLGLEPAARIEGRVKTGKVGVAGAMVTASSDPSSLGGRFSRVYGATDKQGRFVLDEVAVGDPLEVEVTIGMRRIPKVSLPPLAAGESRVVDFDVPGAEGWACRVVDPAGNPVAGAEVVAMKIVPGEGNRLSFSSRDMWDRTFNLTRLGKTDPHGSLEAELPEAGFYDFGVLAKGYGPKLVRGVRVGREPGDFAALAELGPPEEVVLHPAALVSGQVVDAGGQGLAEVALFLSLTDDDPRGGSYRAGPGGTPVTTTEAGGEFSFREVEAGQRFSLLAHKEGFLLARQADASADGEPLRLVLHRAGRLEGKIHSGDQPVVQAWIEVQALEPMPSAGERGRNLRGFSDAAGKYAIEGLGPGRYRLLSHGPAGFQTFSGEPFEVSSGEKKVVDVELEKAVVVFGKVLLPSGEPVVEAQVSHATNAEGEGSVILGSDGQTDALGQYRLANASPGPGWLRVERPGYKTLRRPVQLEEEINEIDLVLEAGTIELAGRVIGPGGEPVAGATVSLGGEEIQRESLSGADGSVSMGGLEAGEYLLQIQQKGYFFKPQRIELKTSRRNLEWRLAAGGSKLHGQILGVAERQLPDLEIAARLVAAEAFRTVDGVKYPVVVGVAGSLDASGRYAIEDLGPGRWSLVAANPRAGAALETKVEVAEGQAELEQDLDFGRLAGPWVAQIRRAGKNLEGIRYFLSSATGAALLYGSSPTGRLELRALPGSYRLAMNAELGPPLEIEIEIGAPSEQVIDMALP